MVSTPTLMRQEDKKIVHVDMTARCTTMGYCDLLKISPGWQPVRVQPGLGMRNGELPLGHTARMWKS
jgi:hypothetical protein